MISATTGYVLVVIFLATIVRSTLGFGEALVAVPLLALRIPVAVAAPFVVAVSVIVAAANLAIDWRHVELRAARGLVLSAFIGLPLGIFMLRAVDDTIVKLLLGATIIGISVYSLVRGAAASARSDNNASLIAAGVVSGILGGAYGMNGPPLAIYGASRGWTPRQFRATLQGYFLVASVAGLLGYGAAGILERRGTSLSARVCSLRVRRHRPGAPTQSIRGGSTILSCGVRRPDRDRFDSHRASCLPRRELKPERLHCAFEPGRYGALMRIGTPTAPQCIRITALSRSTFGK